MLRGLPVFGLLVAVFAGACADAGTDSDASGVPAAEESALRLPTKRRTPPPPTPPTKASLGALLFADVNLSEPAGLACATCHDPAHAYADPRPGATSRGSIAGRVGPRNSPSINYASYAFELSPSGDETGYGGGLFWDGRVSTLQEQATGPLMNPLEMNNPDAATVQRKLQAASYAADFRTLYGATALDVAEDAVAHMADALAAFETTGIAQRFTSKFDAYLAGRATLSAQEAAGLALFDDARTAPCIPGTTLCGCAQCHLDKRNADGSPPLFTDFGYDNIGIPKNTSNPFYSLPPALNPAGASYIDNGLGGWIHNPRQFGHFRAPTLRNVARTAPYGHNGYFADLKSIVHFYNTRDVAAAAWPAPEQRFALNTTGLGNLGLTATEEDAIVAFLGTLDDGYFTP